VTVKLGVDSKWRKTGLGELGLSPAWRRMMLARTLENMRDDLMDAFAPDGLPAAGEARRELLAMDPHLMQRFMDLNKLLVSFILTV
jgi:hypothetical protein